MQSLKLARKNGFVNAQQNSNENSKIRFLKLLLQPILKIFFYLQMLLRLSLIKKYECLFSHGTKYIVWRQTSAVYRKSRSEQFVCIFFTKNYQFARWHFHKE